jgi:hypothetical protein
MAIAKTRYALIPGVIPRSRREISLWLMPDRSATRRWLNPACCRPRRNRCPTSIVSSVGVSLRLGRSRWYASGIAT